MHAAADQLSGAGGSTAGEEKIDVLRGFGIQNRLTISAVDRLFEPLAGIDEGDRAGGHGGRGGKGVAGADVMVPGWPGQIHRLPCGGQAPAWGRRRSWGADDKEIPLRRRADNGHNMERAVVDGPVAGSGGLWQGLNTWVTGPDQDRSAVEQLLPHCRWFQSSGTSSSTLLLATCLRCTLHR